MPSEKQHLRIDPEFRDLIPPITDDERTGLEVKILAEGCTDPVRYWQNDPDGASVIDGHNRIEICKEHKKPYKGIGIKFDSRDAVRLWILENQCSRRNLTDDQRAAVWELIRQERSKALVNEQRKGASKAASAVRGKQKTETTGSDTVSDPVKRDSRAEAAAEAKVSGRKMKDMAAISKADPETAKEVLEGTKTIRQAKADLREEGKLPPARVPVIAPRPPIADPEPSNGKANGHPASNGKHVERDDPAPEPKSPWQEVAEQTEGIIGELNAVAQHMRKAYGAISHGSEKGLANPGAKRYSWSGTVGHILEAIRYLKTNMPVGENSKGVVTAYDQEKEEKFQARKGVVA